MTNPTVPEEFKKRISQHHEAVNKLINGDATLWKQLTSKSDDVSVTGAWGGYEKGWAAVGRRFEWAASNFKGKDNHCRFENVTTVYTPDLAYSLDIEYNEVGLIDRDEKIMMALRVTTIFRRENGEWKMLHRHGDPIIKQRPIDTVVKKE